MAVIIDVNDKEPNIRDSIPSNGIFSSIAIR